MVNRKGVTPIVIEIRSTCIGSQLKVYLRTVHTYTLVVRTNSVHIYSHTELCIVFCTE